MWWAHGEPDRARGHLDQAGRLFKAVGVPRYSERVERLATEWRTPLAGNHSA